MFIGICCNEDALPYAGGATATEGQNNSVLDLKKEIVSAVASLDRGFAATESQMELLDSLCQKLEAAGGPVTLSWSTNSMNHLDGRWRLIYTSGFATGSVGGRRPGPRYTDLPFTIGQVYQDISSTKAELDNIVELHWRASLASLPFVVDALNAQPPMVTARLRHSMEFVGPKQVQIVFEATEVKLSGGLSGWLDNVPAFTAPRLPEYLQPPPRLRAATFDVTYLDAEMRLSRGDRGELRIYLKGMI